MFGQRCRLPEQRQAALEELVVGNSKQFCMVGVEGIF